MAEPTSSLFTLYRMELIVDFPLRVAHQSTGDQLGRESQAVGSRFLDRARAFAKQGRWVLPEFSQPLLRQHRVEASREEAGQFQIARGKLVPGKAPQLLGSDRKRVG